VTAGKDSTQTGTDQRPGSLPFLADVPELLRVRVSPAEFSRVLGVSKQSVSRWIKAGKVTLAYDGRIDMRRGVEQVLRNTDPGQLRARVLRQAVGDVQELREIVARVDEREAAIRAEAAQRDAELRRHLAAADSFADQLGRAEALLLDLIVENRDELREYTEAAAWRRVLRELAEAAWAASAEGPPAAESPTSGAQIPEPAGDWSEAVAWAEACSTSLDAPAAEAAS